MRYAVACDHAGFPLKETVVAELKSLGNDVLDLGTDSLEAVDYPDFAAAAAEAVSEKRVERAVVVCGSGVGASVVVNKIPGVRGALCHDSFSARQGVEDDDMNVLCLGARIIGPELAKEAIRAFEGARFSGLERHVRRSDKIDAIEARYFKQRG
ncbi:MAG: RpiB/LacA/LacB family sugar-phosphate isomerase [Dehalococcoidia bacterium]|nr:RpiB/LacA/LacB family sugar-phosphate isomerase [Dehalococcoidia bacterium]